MEVASGGLRPSSKRVVPDMVALVSMGLVTLSDEAACSVSLSSGRVCPAREAEANSVANRVEKPGPVEAVTDSMVALAWTPSEELLSVLEVVGSPPEGAED